MFVVATGLGVVALFPTYVRGSEANSANTGLVLLHVLPLVAWVLAGAMALSGRREVVRVAAGLAAGAVVVTAGLDLSAIGQLTSSHLHAEVGFWLDMASGGAALLATVLLGAALVRSRVAGEDRRWPVAPTVLVVLGGAATAVGYSFGWRRYRIASSVLHNVGFHTIPSVFDDASLVMTGAAVVVAGVSLVPAVALGWRDRRAAVSVALGALIGLSGYVALDLVEVVGRASLGLSAKVMAQYKVHLTATPTGWFWLAVAGIVVLLGVGLVGLVRGGVGGVGEDA